MFIRPTPNSQFSVGAFWVSFWPLALLRCRSRSLASRSQTLLDSWHLPHLFDSGQHSLTL